MAPPRYAPIGGSSNRRKIPSRKLLTTVFLAGAFLLALFWLVRDRHTVQDFVSYSTRPAWDAPDGPKTLLPHLQADGVPDDDAAACKRHSWQLRTAKPKVIDAFLFATELELLEVRLRELWDVVDEFVIVESTYSLMGQAKVCLHSSGTRVCFS